MFKHGRRDWVEYRQLLPDLMEVDFHWSGGETPSDYRENMQKVWDTALHALIKAQEIGKQHVMFTHGSSTSRRGETTARSQVRKLLSSKEATPYVIRSKCIQQDSVFVAAIRPLDSCGDHAFS